MGDKSNPGSMEEQLFRERHGALQTLFESDGAVAAIRASEELLKADLEEEKSHFVGLMRAQFLIELPERHEEAAEALHLHIKYFRERFMAGHPDRDQVESIHRQAFGPKSLVNPPELRAAWEVYQRAAGLCNDGESEKAVQLLATIDTLEDIILRSHCHMARTTLNWNLSQPEEAVHQAHQAADLVASLEPGHWTRRAVESSVLSKVCVIRKSVFEEPLRGALSQAINAVNEQSQASLRLWREAMKLVNESDDAKAKAEAGRMNRLLTGFEGPLALLVAMEAMQKARDRGDHSEIVLATEAAYYIAYEHDAHTSARELESFLVSVGRF